MLRQTMFLSTLSLLLALASPHVRAEGIDGRTSLQLDVEMSSGDRSVRIPVKVVSKCALRILELNGTLNAYANRLYQVDARLRKESGLLKITQIRSILDRELAVETAIPGSSCFDAVAVIYAWQSTLQLIQPSSDRDSLTRLVTGALERGVLTPLTLADREARGGIWSARKRKRFKILGAYDCTPTAPASGDVPVRSTIAFDYTLPPMDLGGVMLHELEHLSRDKLTYWKANGASGPFGEASAYALLMIDETLATLHGAYAQLSLARDENRSRDDQARESRREESERIAVPFDLNLYRKHGALEKIWASAVSSGGFPRFAPFADFLGLVTSPANYDSFRAILQLVSRVYFPSLPVKVDPILERLSLGGPDVVSGLGSLASPRATGTESDDSVATILDRLGERSAGCARLAQALESREASGYIGADTGTKPGHEGSKPGHEGSKPGHEGSKPGHEGSKPGHEGSKPGHEGSKPGHEGSKPGHEGSKPALTVLPCAAPAAP